jgi:hypothetical protein
VTNAAETGTPHALVSLYWLPLGAGDHCVKANGRVYEAVLARYERRPVCDLYHSALKVELDTDSFVIESAPAWGSSESERGVVCVGPVGLSWLGRSRFFRYEVRRWRNGVIADAAAAVGGPVNVRTVRGKVERLLELVPHFPDSHLGSRRAPCRRDVELQLAHPLAAGSQGARCRPTAATSVWPRARVVGRCGGGGRASD